MAGTIDLAKHFALFLILLSGLCHICNGADRKNVLFSGKSVNRGEVLRNGNYTLKFQIDCVLGLFDAGKRIWASSNPGFDRFCQCELQDTGRFVIYGNRGFLWTAFSDLVVHDNGGYALILQNDRNLVIHGPVLWCEPNCLYNQPDDTDVLTDPFQKRIIADADVGCEADKGIVLYTSQSLRAGECLKYGRIALKMQKDCNLVMYDGDKAIWATNTDGKGQNCYLHMPYDGNLAVRGTDLRVLWSAFPRWKDDGNYVLVLSRSRRIRIYGTSIWATGTNIANEIPAINDNVSTAETITVTNGAAL